ncbi:hypothetical protein OOT46_02775 [Aquabacterium sp. A7-Y]|uniref:hypothetical protein n=1 Tax=Aquabacterium sp. A7-Y TaxID=1349605 RepID=UPI00223CDAD9|nr:hypothetical protein [Aquabacterium sp. A7-Y]MCW7536777.1 hypothetical protein [Aquabacterium sp. A7-Y]
MDQLPSNIVERQAEPALSCRDLKAIEQIVSWEVQPRFFKPGRTAWYVLQDPVRMANGGPLLLAAKLKGVGAWNPADPRVRSGIKGAHPVGVLPPSVAEYEETARTVHFGVDAEGEFRGVHSEPAPFGAILLRRARQEYENAEVLHRAGVPSIVPFALWRYGREQFKGEPIGAVVSLAPDESPYSLDFLYETESNPTSERHAHFEAVMKALGIEGGLDEPSRVTAQSKVALLVGRAMRRFAQAGLYRYSAVWDNFYFNKNDGEVYLTDLDSSRRLAELPPEIGGMQVLRDLAGALWRLPKQFSERGTIHDFHLGSLLEVDALAAMVCGYFEIDQAEGKRLVDPLWAYFLPHWFLLKRHGPEVSMWTKEKCKTYRLDKDVFHCLAILVLAQAYRKKQSELGLPPLPSTAELRRRIRAFLGEQMDYVDWLASRLDS